MFTRFWNWLMGRKPKVVITPPPPPPPPPPSTVQLEDGTDLLAESGSTIDLEQ